MEHPIGGLDHALVLVEDLDRARAQFAALGFTVSPRGLHSASRGTANHTVMLAGAYVELLGILRPMPLNAERRASIAAAGPGLHGLAFRIADAPAVPAALAARGVQTHSASDFSRPVPLAGGGEAVARFRTHQMARAQFPVGMAFLCEHLTPELLWQPPLLDHPNGAQHIAAVIAVSATPAADAALFARRLGWRAQVAGGVARVLPPDGRSVIELHDRAAHEDRFPPARFGTAPAGIHAGLRIAVADLDRARAAIAAGGGQAIAHAEGLVVPPARACGMLLILSAAER